MSEQTLVPTELEGTWEPVMLEWQGRFGPAPDGAAWLRVMGGEFTVKSGDYVFASGVVRVDATARPRRVEFRQPLGPGWWSVQAGIYEIVGDEVRLRLSENEVHPEGFDGVRGLGVYRRDQGEGRS
jgi:uncharacterized protein (TIGR03067 family)